MDMNDELEDDEFDIDVEKELDLPPYNPSPANPISSSVGMPPIPTVMPSSFMVEQSPSSIENQPPMPPSLMSTPSAGINNPLGQSIQNSLSVSRIVTNSDNPYSQMDNKTRKTTICNCVNDLNNLLLSLSVSVEFFHDI